jgi:hypothetical protein
MPCKSQWLESEHVQSVLQLSKMWVDKKALPYKVHQVKNSKHSFTMYMSN